MFPEDTTERCAQDYTNKQTQRTGNYIQASSRCSAKEDRLKTPRWRQKMNWGPKWFPENIRPSKIVPQDNGSNRYGAGDKSQVPTRQ